VRFVPNGQEEKKEMLAEIGVAKAEELFSDIPKKSLIVGELKIPRALSEKDLRKEIEGIAAKNKNAKQLALFLGGGCYSHFIPAAVPAITGRSEFYTAYTPYQPEMSQGMLQVIFEWQSYICMLTGMDLANASMYDGATAAAEAMIMAKNATGRKKILVAKSVNPQYKEVLATYATAGDLQFREIEAGDAGKEIDGETACLIVQQPDFFGRIGRLEEIGKAAHAKGALLVVAIAEAMSLGFAEKPARYGADIVAMDVQSFGNSMSFGGPAAGVIACTQALMRHIPGRLVGRTVDSEGKQGFVLTLQAREQHIRREKASSNICSNEALCALAATVYLAAVGEKGLREIAEENHEKALLLAQKIEKLGFKLRFGKDFFNEFVVEAKNARGAQKKLLKKGIVFGYLLEDDFPQMKGCILLAATEMNTIEEIENLAEALKVSE